MHTTAEPSTNRLRNRRRLLVPLKLLVFPLIGLVAGYYLKENGYWPTVLADDPTPRSAAHNGLPAPVINSLAVAYVDADGDLIADPPTNEEQLVDPPQLIFSPLSESSSAEAAERWQPLVDHLAKATGKAVKLRLGLEDPVDRLIELRDGKVHITCFDAGVVPKAVNACGFVPVAKRPTPDGQGSTKMVLIVPAESAANSAEHLKWREFTFVGPDSNTGFKAAVIALRNEFSLRPGRDFTWAFSGSQEASIKAIKEQRSWVAAVDQTVLKKEVAAGHIAAGQFRTIYESEPFPTAAIGYAHDLNPAIARKLREALLSFDWKGSGLETVLGQKRTKFLPVNYKAEWALLRKIDDATGTAHIVEYRADD